MARWTRDRSLEVLPRPRDFLTPGGYRVPVALRWHQLVEYAQRHGVALEDLSQALGIPKGATLPERRRRMRLVSVEDLEDLENLVRDEIERNRSTKGAVLPLVEPCTVATEPPSKGSDWMSEKLRPRQAGNPKRRSG